MEHPTVNKMQGSLIRNRKLYLLFSYCIGLYLITQIVYFVIFLWEISIPSGPDNALNIAAFVVFALSFGSLIFICLYFRTGWWLIALLLLEAILWIFLLLAPRFMDDRSLIMQIASVKGIVEFLLLLSTFFVRTRQVSMLFSWLGISLLLLRFRPMMIGYLSEYYGFSYSATAIMSVLPTLVLLALNVKMYNIIRTEEQRKDLELTLGSGL